MTFRFYSGKISQLFIRILHTKSIWHSIMTMCVCVCVCACVCVCVYVCVCKCKKIHWKKGSIDRKKYFLGGPKFLREKANCNDGSFKEPLLKFL